MQYLKKLGRGVLLTLSIVIHLSTYVRAQTNYSPLYTSANFTKTIDLSKPVGTVGGSPGTTGSGGISYSIPIYAPPGTNGMQPSVSIVYNSQGSSGVVGFGWNIAGLSVISRTGKNLYHNSEVAPVEYTWNDAFLLDGARLNPVQGNNADDGTIYATESESFSKTISFRGNGSLANPDWFQVTSKDGSVMEFGNTVDSRIVAENGYSVMLWRLNRIIDINGNYIDFKYDNTGRDSRIDEISYTGNINTGLLPYNKIKFTYGYRNEKNTSYDGGASLSSIYLLNKITVTTDGGIDPNGEPTLNEQIKTYQFNYGFDNVHSLLKEVIESGVGIGSAAPTLNSTIFLYGDQPENITTSAQPGLAGEHSFHSGDFDADGKTDLLLSESYFNSEMSLRLDTKMHLIKDLNGSGYSVMYMQDLPQGTQIENHSDKNFYNFLAADYDKDGRDDVLRVRLGYSTLYQKRFLDYITINYTRSLNTSTTGYYDYDTVHLVAPPGAYKYINESGNFFIPGDFDGDGSQDYLLILGKWLSGSQFDYKGFITYPAKNIINLEVPNISAGMLNPYFPPSPAAPIAAADIITPLDVNGDGKIELLVTPSYNSFSYLIAADGNYNSLVSPYPGSGEVLQGCKVFPGDFNGDRKTDMLVKNTNGTWKIVYSTGTSFFSEPFSFNQNPVLTGSGFCIDRIVVSDFNGDGKSDIVHGISSNCASSGILSVYYSKGYGSGFRFEQYTMPWALSSSHNATNPFTTGDFNGDGRTDLLNIVNNSGAGGLVYFKPYGQERLLKKVTDGHNTTVAFEYKALTDKSTYPYVYNRTVSLDNPVNQTPYNYVQLPMNVVSSVTSPDGIGGTSTTSYFYEDAVVHRYAKGFLGFKKVIAKNTTANTTSITENEINTQFATPHTTRQTTKLTSSNELLSEATITNTFVNLSTGVNDIRYFQKIDKTFSVDHLNGTASESINTYDNYGNITTNISKIGEPSGNTVIPTETNTTTTTFSIHNTPFPAKPDNITVSNLRTGQAVVSSTSTFTYKNNGLLASQTVFAGLPKAVTTSYSYNAFGNATQVLTSASGLANRIANATFDTKGRFPLTKQAVGTAITQTETYTYDGKWGKPLSQTTPDCLTTTFEYDAFGRMKKTTMPEGYAVNNSLVWDIQGEQLYYSFTDFPGGKPDSKTWMDKMGREIKTQTMGFNGQWLTQLTYYDYKGNAYSKTNPYYAAETPVITTTSYDAYNRPVSVTNPLTTITSTYTKLTGGKMQVTTQNSAGQSSSKIADAAGKIITAIDNGGQLDYTYDSRGNQTETKHGTTVMVTSTYDVYGRQTSLVDKNAGTVNYQYDAFGQLTQQTDNLGNTYTMLYDDFGRITSRNGNEGITAYEYYTGTVGFKCKGHKLKKVTGFNGVVKEYTYDNLRRLQSEKVTVDGLDYTTNYTYDTYSNPDGTIYPSGVVVNNVYDNSGNIVSVTGGDSWNPVTLFSANAENGYGQLTSYTLGNGKTSQNTYQYGMPTRFYTQGVQDLNLSFDFTKGNLNSRYDALKNLTETFQYDNLNRLTTTTVNGVQQLNINYDGSGSFSMGNITSKTDAGNYVYSNTKIHAVNYITNPAGATAPPITISPTQQQITYTPFLKTASIIEGSVQTNFTYGPDYQRIKTEMLVSGNINTTKYFLGGFERIINGSTVRDIHYIPVGNSIAIIEKYLYSSSSIHFVYTDYLGSLLTRTDISGNITAEQNFDAWGRSRNTNDWQYAGAAITPSFFDRGYTGHEMLPYHYLINMNGRMYDPIQGRMLSPDNYVPDPWHTQGYNRYSYANNNPLKFTDPDGNSPLVVIAIAAAIFGAGNTVAHAIRGDINSVWDGFRYFAQGAITGAAVAAGVMTGLGIPVIKGLIIGAGIAYSTTTGLSLASGLTQGIFSGDWTTFRNAGQIFLGNFYLDENRSFLGGVWQGASRFSWEIIQTTFGYGFSQLNNAFGGVDEVNYFGGATFAVGTNRDVGQWGVSIGSFINASLNNENTNVPLNPLLMHEYGHYIQGQKFGLLYPCAVMMPSLISSLNQRQVPGEPANVTTHDFRTFEMGANRSAARYFGRYFGVDWGTLETFFPRRRR